MSSWKRFVQGTRYLILRHAAPLVATTKLALHTHCNLLDDSFCLVQPLGTDNGDPEFVFQRPPKNGNTHNGKRQRRLYMQTNASSVQLLLTWLKNSPFHPSPTFHHP
jgi:hypothetical protein